jgi:hypothetical protein
VCFVCAHGRFTLEVIRGASASEKGEWEKQLVEKAKTT